MAMIQTKFYKNPFAVHGDKAQLPETAQPDGKLNYETGYTLNYELDPETNPSGLDIERLQFNQVLYDLTLNMYQYQIYGTPNFITSEMNGGNPFPYPMWAYALYDDGINGMQIYRSKSDNNTALPTDSTKWDNITQAKSTPDVGFTADYSGVTPTPHIQIPNDTDVQLKFPTAFANVPNCYNPATGEFKAPYNGLYDFDIAVSVGTVNTSASLVGLVRVNGVTVLSADTVTITNGTSFIGEAAASRKLRLNKDDIVTFYVRQINNSAQTLILAVGTETYASCALCFTIEE